MREKSEGRFVTESESGAFPADRASLEIEPVPATDPLPDRAPQTPRAHIDQVLGSLGLGVIKTDASDRVQSADARVCEMLGCDPTDLVTCRLADLLSAESRAAHASQLAALKAGAVPAAVELAFLREDMTPLYARCAISPRHGRDGYALVLLDITDRVEAEHAARQSEARLRQILDNAVALIGIMELDGTLVEANKPALAGGGLAREEVIGKKFWDCYWWSHDAETVEQLKQAVAAAARGEEQRYDATVRMANDTLVPIDFMLSPVTGPDGKVAFLVPSGVEISDRKRYEEQLGFVMREVNHRSKNLLAVVQAMLRQMRPREVGQFVQDFGDRLRALAACQDLLLQSSEDSPLLSEVVRAQLRHFRDLSEMRLQVTGPALRVSPDTAQSIGMAIYELATNAAKYGALSNADGRIQIDWALFDTPEGPRFRMSWTELDGPPVSAPTAKGFGSVVLEDMLAMTLDAEIEMRFLPTGVTWSLTCPASAFSPNTP